MEKGDYLAIKDEDLKSSVEAERPDGAIDVANVSVVVVVPYIIMKSKLL